jgi:hypothetical protein
MQIDMPLAAHEQAFFDKFGYVPHLDNPDGLGFARPEEEEPCFHELLLRAKARVERSADSDGKMIADLLAVIEHYDNTIDMYYWSMSDNRELPHDA